MDRSANKKMAIILHSGDYDKVHHALSIALAAVTNGIECHIFVAYDALGRLTKKRIDEVPVDALFQRPLRKLVQEAKSTGLLKIYACGTTLALMGISRNELVEDFDEVSGLSAFLAQTEGSEFTFFI
ncbi:MAG: DsrE family protein [Nitrososphaerota archaeon]